MKAQTERTASDTATRAHQRRRPRFRSGIVCIALMCLAVLFGSQAKGQSRDSLAKEIAEHEAQIIALSRKAHVLETEIERSETDLNLARRLLNDLNFQNERAAETYATTRNTLRDSSLALLRFALAEAQAGGFHDERRHAGLALRFIVLTLLQQKTANEEDLDRLATRIATAKQPIGRLAQKLEQARQNHTKVGLDISTHETAIRALTAELDGFQVRLAPGERANEARRSLLKNAAPREDFPPFVSARAPFSEQRGNLNAPIEGTEVMAFDTPVAGEVAGASIYAARTARSQVVAPYDARVTYVDRFGNFGITVVLDFGAPFRLLLAGMETALVEKGQILVAGEPVGLMGRPASALTLLFDPPPDTPLLYVELQNETDPIDARLWWSQKR